MEFEEIIGFSAALFTTLASVPQAWKIVKEGSAKMVSLFTYVILAFGTGLWVVYGVMKDDYPLILANGISTLVSVSIITLKLIPKRQLEKMHEQVATGKKKSSVD